MGKSGTPRGGGVDVRAVKRTDSLAVATAAVKATTTLDTRLDRAPVDGQRRVSALMTPQLASVLARPLSSQSGVGAGFPGWEALRTHQGWSTATVENADELGAGDQGNTSSHKLLVTMTGHDAHGWKQQLSADPWVVQLSRATAKSPWQVQSIEWLGAN